MRHLLVDFACQFSKEENSIIRELLTKYPDRVRLQVRDFPVDELHPEARQTAEAAVCAHAQGKYWAMHDLLFATAGNFTDADLLKYAKNIGLDETKFSLCLKDPQTAAEVQTDIEAGTAAGVPGTPTFFINGIKVEGAIPADIWEQIVKLSVK